MDTQQSAANELPQPMQAEEKRNPAFHLFLYLVSFLSLGFLVTGIIGTYFQLVNKIYKKDVDTLRYVYEFDQSFLKFAISALLVTIPIYYGVIYFINRKLHKGEISASSLIRKFSTYLALFVFSAMALGSLVNLVYNYLDGELTTKAFLKIAIFFVVSIFFFAFYLWEVRRKGFAKNFLALYLISLAIAVSALVVGFIIIDSPRVVREKKQDNELVNAMRNMTYQIENFYAANQRLPKLMDREIVSTKDIQYVEAGEKEYKLCGNFNQVKEKEYSSDEWAHPAGQYCFDFNVKTKTQQPISEPIMPLE